MGARKLRTAKLSECESKNEQRRTCPRYVKEEQLRREKECQTQPPTRRIPRRTGLEADILTMPETQHIGTGSVSNHGGEAWATPSGGFCTSQESRRQVNKWRSIWIWVSKCRPLHKGPGCDSCCHLGPTITLDKKSISIHSRGRGSCLWRVLCQF